MTLVHERWLVVYELLRRVSSEHHELGKTKLQKLVYFLQQLDADLGYRFELHKYGPYSYDLAGDLSVLENLEVIRVHREPGGSGYQISEARRPVDVSEALLRRTETALNRVVGTLAPLGAQELEVMATVHFIAQALRRRNREPRREEVLDIVKSLKPSYNQTFIEEQYARLSELPNAR